jgi:hypothetical protein
MADLGTISILVDVRGQPIVKELATDLSNVAKEEVKVSVATQRVMADFKRMQQITAMLKKDTDAASASFQRFSAKELQQASQRMQGFESSLANTRRGMGQMGMATQQVGYQVGDFLVQIQSGTSAFVAFGQQATQLVGILPAFSGVLGMSVGSLIALSSGLGIAIPLLTAIGAVFMRTSEESEVATQSVNKQKEAYDALVTVIEDLRLKRGMLQSDAGSEQEQNALNAIYQLELKRSVLQQEAEELQRRINEGVDTGLEYKLMEIQTAIKANEAEKSRLETVLRISQEEADRLATLEAQLKAEGQAEELARLKKDAFHAMAGEMSAVSSSIFEAKTNAEGLAAVDIEGGIAAAANSAMALARNLGVSFEVAKKLAAGGYSNTPTVFDPRDPRYDPAKVAQESQFGFKYNRTLQEITKSASGAAKGIAEVQKSAESLRRELDQPLVSAVGSISDAFGDFVARGLKDFKGFVQQILGSFKNMIAQMIAMAVKNRIMLSLGIGGITPGMAAAGQVAGLGSAGGMMGSLGIGQGIAGLAGGTGFLGGMGNAVSGLAGGGAGFLGIGGNAALAGGGALATIGAAIPVIGAVAAAFSFFKKKTKELDAGLRITVTNMDALVKSFQTIQTKRFWGLSKKTTTTESEVSAEISDPIVEAVQKMQTQIVKAAELFGISSDAFENFVYDFEVSLKGLTEEQKIQKVNEEIVKMGDAFTALSGQFTSMNELLLAAQERYDLTTRLLQAQGKEEELLTRQRELELAAVQDVNKALLEQIHAQEDANRLAEQTREIERQALAAAEEAARLAAKISEDKAQIEIKLLEAQGKAAEALAAQRATELAALDETNRALLQQVFDQQDLNKAQEEANRVAEEAKKLAEEKTAIELKLLELQGKANEALTLQREKELAAVDESNRELLKLTYAMEDYNTALSKTMEAVEESTRVYEGALSDLRQAMDREMSAAQSALDNAQSVLDNALQNQLGILEGNLSSAEDAVRNAQQSLEEAQRREFEATIRSRIAAVNNSFASLISSIEQRLEVAQQKAEASRRIFEVLDSALQERRLVTAGREFASRQAALSYVSGGGSDPERLSSALSVLNEPTEQLFSSFQDYARDFALTTNAIQESRDLAEATMTADEQMVVLLEQQLESSKASQEAQLEALEKLLEVQEEFLTVTEATQQLLEAQETYDQAKTAHEELLAQYPQLQETFITVGDALAQYLAAQATFEQVQKQHEELLAQFTGLNETLLTVAQATANLNSAITAQSAAQQAQADAQAALAKAIADAAAISVAEAVPAFAYGGMHSGGMRLVGENGPELEVTGPSRIYSNRDTANMFRDPQLAGAVDGLRREVSGMRSEQLQLQVEISKNVKRVYDIERKWDTDGLPPERV